MQAAEPIASDPLLPRVVDVVVIGGGIVGVSTAFFLIRRGISVALLEKGRIAGEQSGRNMGWVRTIGREIAEIPLMLESRRIWEGLNDAVDAETGYRRRGVTYFAETEMELHAHRQWLQKAAKYETGADILSAQDANALVPGCSRAFAGALHTGDDGMAEPSLAALAIVRAAARLGAKVLTFCAARAIEVQGRRVSGVFTERGLIACRTVIVAGGGWSSFFLRNLGIRLPQLKLLSQVIRTAPVAAGPEGCGLMRGFGFRRRLDGGYDISGSVYPVDIVPDSIRYFRDFRGALRSATHSLRFRVSKRSLAELFMRTQWLPDQSTPFETYRCFEPAPSARVLRHARKTFDAAFPHLRTVSEIGRWGGLVDVTPDAVPIISAVPDIPGLFVSTGFSGHGFGLGPGAGMLMAQLITGDEPMVDPSPFSFSRPSLCTASRVNRF